MLLNIPVNIYIKKNGTKYPLQEADGERRVGETFI